MNNELMHVGVAHDENPPGRGSGRFPYGSGEKPGQHQFTFRSEVARLRKNGLKDAEIAKMILGEKANTTSLKTQIAIETKKERQANRARAVELYNKYGNKSEVARRMGINESSVRLLLDEVLAERTNKYENTAEMLKKSVKDRGMIDISSGTELELGITKDTLKVAVQMLENEEGYVKSWVQIPQMGTQNKTTVKILAPPVTTFGEIQKNKYNIKSIREYTPDKGKTWWTPEFPESVDSKRVMIRYAEDGGKEKDGIIELRRGVEDISLGGSKYAQVRIAVDGKYYMKGMAVYSDDMPKGVDIIYNSNKNSSVPKEKVFKEMKIDQKTGEVDRDNPFGALIKSPKDRDGVITASGQRHYIDKDGNEKLSPINKLQDEGDWDSWSRTLSSQFLSKQPLKLINQQIDLSVADKKTELDQIMNLTNPVIKKKLLDDFANGCDANAASLSVKGFKNQAFQVILPIPELKDNEIYAPNYKDGDTVALVRYPHGGTFEIPVLKVNNKNQAAKKVMGNASDAVGINASVAERLSGADFDGDTALVIPLSSNKLKITSTEPLRGLKGFDPKESYKLPDDAPNIKNSTKQNQMGQVTNLITDMTVGGANQDEIAKAVRHSMVVIDSEKHHLDYKKSARDNDITKLKKMYQGTEEGGSGASTILSRAKAKEYVIKRKEITDTKKMTPAELERWNNGLRVFRNTTETTKELITDTKKMTPAELQMHNAGKKVYRDTGKLKTEKLHQMDVVDNAIDLVRDKTNPKEMAYANYANQLKSLANEARKEARSIKPIPVSQTAKKTYSKEVEDLNRKLRVALMNSPKERQAQIIANQITQIKFNSNPDMDFEHKQRARAIALNQARAQVGAKKEQIVITDREWEAIQANAISTHKLIQILGNTDQDAFKKRATPRGTNDSLGPAQLNLIKAMVSSGMYTQKEIADRLGVSPSTISATLRKSV